MSARSNPTPRRSSLHASPVTPPEGEGTDQPPNGSDEPARRAPELARDTASTAAGPGKRRRSSPRLQAYVTDDELARVRAAWWHTHVQEGQLSLNDLIREAVLDHVEQLERQYNQGESFPPAPRELPRGRR
jgi:hypothetical protein